MVVVRETEVESRHKKRINTVVVPSMEEVLDYFVYGFKKDIEEVLDNGLSSACLARSLSVDRSAVYRWRSGKHCPREPMIMFSIKRWAEQIREAKEVNNG